VRLTAPRHETTGQRLTKDTPWTSSVAALEQTNFGAQLNVTSVRRQIQPAPMTAAMSPPRCSATVRACGARHHRPRGHQDSVGLCRDRIGHESSGRHGPQCRVRHGGVLVHGDPPPSVAEHRGRAVRGGAAGHDHLEVRPRPKKGHRRVSASAADRLSVQITMEVAAPSERIRGFPLFAALSTGYASAAQPDVAEEVLLQGKVHHRPRALEAERVYHRNDPVL